MGSFVGGGGVLSDVVYSERAPGAEDADSAVAPSKTRGLFAKRDVAGAVVTVPASLTVSWPGALETPVHRLLRPAFERSQVWGVALLYMWRLTRPGPAWTPPLQAPGPHAPSLFSDATYHALRNTTGFDALQALEREAARFEAHHATLRRFSSVFPPAFFDATLARTTFLRVHATAIGCRADSPGVSPPGAPETTTVLVGPMLDLLSFRNDKEGGCRITCADAGCAAELSVGAHGAGEEVCWNHGGLTDAEAFVKFGELPARPDRWNRVALQVPLADGALEPDLRRRQEAHIGKCGPASSFCVNAAGVSEALLCATRVGAAVRHEVDPAEVDPNEPISEGNERAALGVLAATLEAILEGYPTSTDADEDLLRQAARRDAVTSAVQLRLNEKNLVINALNQLRYYEKFTLPRLKFQQAGSFENDGEL